MAKRTAFCREIDDPKAPERLRGKSLKAVVDDDAGTLTFEVDIPEDATPNELGYMRWMTSEFVDFLNERLGIKMEFKSQETRADFQ